MTVPCLVSSIAWARDLTVLIKADRINMLSTTATVLVTPVSPNGSANQVLAKTLNNDYAAADRSNALHNWYESRKPSRTLKSVLSKVMSLPAMIYKLMGLHD